MSDELDLNFDDFEIDKSILEMDQLLLSLEEPEKEISKPKIVSEVKTLETKSIKPTEEVKHLEKKSEEPTDELFDPATYVFGPPTGKPRQIFINHYFGHGGEYYTSNRFYKTTFSFDYQFIKFKGIDQQVPGTIPIHRWANKNPEKGYTYDFSETYKNDSNWKDDGVLCFVFKEPKNIFDPALNPRRQMLKPLRLFQHVDMKHKFELDLETKKKEYTLIKTLGFVFEEKIYLTEIVRYHAIVFVSELKFLGTTQNGKILSYYQSNNPKNDKFTYKNYGTPTHIFVGLAYPNEYAETKPIYCFMKGINVYYYGDYVENNTELTMYEFVCRLFTEKQEGTSPIYIHLAQDTGKSCRMSPLIEIKGFKNCGILGYAYETIVFGRLYNRRKQLEDQEKKE
jgi:hypothetical protein